MDIDKVIVSRTNVSPTAAEIMQSFFVGGCNKPDRPNMLFEGAVGVYDDENSTMTIEAGLKRSTSATVGREAIDRAFGFAEAMDVAS